MTSPRISVLMPVFNAGPFLDEAIRSVLQQTYADFELLALDDGSHDDSLAILQRHARRDARVQVVSRPNRGLVATRNELLSLASGEFVALLDADDVASATRLERQVAFLDARPACVAVGSQVMLIDDGGLPLCRLVEEFEHAELYATMLAGRGHHLYNPAVMMRRAAVEQVGGYRDGFAPAEDLDLFLRLAEVGELANLPEVLTHYRQHLASEGHVRRQTQCDAAFRAVNDARARRGLPPLERAATVYQLHPTTIADHFRKWSWWAQGAGHHAAARKYARAAARHAPLSLESWRVLYCAYRLGRREGMARQGTPAQNQEREEVDGS